MGYIGKFNNDILKGIQMVCKCQRRVCGLQRSDKEDVIHCRPGVIQDLSCWVMDFNKGHFLSCSCKGEVNG